MKSVPERRVLISGVAGFLGSHLADAMLADGWDVVGVDNLIGGYLDNVPAGVSFQRADCNDLATMRALMEGVSVVYHCAATAYEGLSVFSPHFVTRNVVTSTTGMMSAAIASRVRRFVFCSSMARYGAIAVPFTEDAEPRPQDPYGIGKLAAEMLVRNLAETHGVEWVVAVPHNIIGPRQKYDDPYRNVAAIMINRMLRGKQPIIYGDGSQLRGFSFVADAVTCLERMGEEPAAEGQIINIGPDEETTSVLQLAEEIAEIMSFRVDPIFVPARPLEVKHATCSADKARKLLGYQTSTSLRDGLTRMIEWMAVQDPMEFSYGIEIEIPSPKTPKTWVDRLI